MEKKKKKTMIGVKKTAFLSPPSPSPSFFMLPTQLDCGRFTKRGKSGDIGGFFLSGKYQRESVSCRERWFLLAWSEGEFGFDDMDYFHGIHQFKKPKKKKRRVRVVVSVIFSRINRRQSSI